MAPRSVVALVLTLAVLAGCSDSSPAPEPEAEGSASPADAMNETALPRLLPWERVTLYFTADGALSFTKPEAGSVVLASPATIFVTGADAPDFVLPPAPHAILFMDEVVDATLFLRSAGPQASNGGFDIGIWGGTTQGYGLDHIGTTAAFTAPGEVQEVRASLAFDGRRAFLVPAGESIQFLVAGPIGRESGEPHLLVGGDQASQVEVTLANFTVDPLMGVTGVATEDFAGDLTGGTAFFCPPLPGSEPGSHDIAVHPDAAWLHLAIEAEAADYDIDFTLAEGDEVVARGSTPRGQEAVFLGAETLGGLQGKTLHLAVTPCGYGPVSYSATLEQGLGGNGTMRAAAQDA